MKYKELFEKGRSTYRDILVIIFNVFLLLLFLEVCASGVLKLFSNQKKENTSYDIARDIHDLARPHFTKEENDQVYYEAYSNPSFEYAPWLQFKHRNASGKYENSVGFLRKTIPDQSFPDTTDAQQVFFFGGSTMYGTGVTDSETIASIFTRLCRQQKIPVKTFNYGVPAFFSYQEYILLVKLLTRGDRPDKVIFMDGLNDVLQAPNSYYQEACFTDRNKQLLARGADSRRNLIKKLWSKTHLYKLLVGKQMPPRNALPEGVSEKEAVEVLVRNYLNLTESIRQLCALYKIDCYFFVQPVPYYNYSNRSGDPIAAKSEQGLDVRFKQFYQATKEASFRREGLFFLGDMLETKCDYPFIDKIHYSPEFSNRVAQRMFQAMRWE